MARARKSPPRRVGAMPRTAADRTPALKAAPSRNGRAAPARPTSKPAAAQIQPAAPRKTAPGLPPRKALSSGAAPRKPLPASATAARRGTAISANPTRRNAATSSANPTRRNAAAAESSANSTGRNAAAAATAAKATGRNAATSESSANPTRRNAAESSANPTRRNAATAESSANPTRRNAAASESSAKATRRTTTAAALPAKATRRNAAAAPPAKTTRRNAAASERPVKTTRRTAARKPAAPAVKPEPPAAPARLSGGIAVVKLLDSKEPMDALRKFLARIAGEATMEEGQIVLGSAQLMLLPIAHENRGGDEVKQLLDLVLARWDAFPDRSGFHAQEFLRNAFAAVGDDRERLARLAALVPTDATSELRFNLAGAYAVVGDRPAMLRALETALASGTTAAQVRRDPDFTGVLADPGVIALLDRAAVPAIPVDVDPYVAPVRAALDALVDTLRELGEPSRFNPPATLEAVLAAERAKQIQLPNDYRALLTITDGMALCDHEFFGTGDYHSETQLAQRARAFLEMSVSYGGIGMDECVPLASWGQPNNWLLYDPRGAVREGDPGYVVMLTADPWPVTDLADALLKIESSVRDARATN